MVLTAVVNGFGKRTPVEDYRLIRRGGKGVINIKTTDRNGDVVSMKTVCDTDELMLITEKGILIRTRVDEIRETGRNAAGVRLIKLDDGDRLVAMAKVDVQEPDVKPDSEPAAGEPDVVDASGGESDSGSVPPVADDTEPDDESPAT
jgi:DNA gyrase subunit A